METIKLNKEWHLGTRIGSGGFGRVFVAQSASCDQAVVKLIPKAPGADRELLFEELSGVLNVVPVIDRGDWNDYWVLVMPRANKSLRDYINEQGGRLVIDSAIKILIDIAEALIAIEPSVVHRDLKPENILLLEEHWCLADFGIARYAAATTAPDTRKYMMTPPYAAPEQWRGERATSATDIYATGVIAYEMIAGHQPFTGPEVHDFRQQHLIEKPPFIQDIPESLRSLIVECLYKAPQARPKPQNFLTRLQSSIHSVSEASQRLQSTYRATVDRQTEVDRQQSAAKSDAERRSTLYMAAEQGLKYLEQVLYAKIVQNAPGCAPTGGVLWPCILNNAELSIDPIHMAITSSAGDRYHSPFEVIAYSRIMVRIPPHQFDYEGRSHSLWFCDAQEADVFRWYETAFMINPHIPKRGRLDPFALEPGDEAYSAISPVMTEFQIAWPFIPVGQGNESEFIERWITWFADAAVGRLRHPSHMPERNASGSWRRLP